MSTAFCSSHDCKFIVGETMDFEEEALLLLLLRKRRLRGKEISEILGTSNITK
jgi:hypothetical protein